MKRTLFLIVASIFIHLNGISQPDSGKTNTQKIKLIGNSHMDPVYRWRWNEMVNRAVAWGMWSRSSGILSWRRFAIGGRIEA
jgi:hypothetical protein